LIPVQAAASHTESWQIPVFDQDSNLFMNMRGRVWRFSVWASAVLLGICVPFLYGGIASASDDKTLAVIVPDPDAVDFSLWSPARVKAYKVSLAVKTDPPLGVLSIPRLRLTVPIFEGADDATLDRGLGRVPGSVMLGEKGNLAIAGHRDGFFGVLKDIKRGGVIRIESSQSKDTYVVQAIKVVDRKDMRVLSQRKTATVTLITCYPFYFIGHAPRRYIVTASLKVRVGSQAARASDR